MKTETLINEEVQKIIAVTRELRYQGSTGGCTSEQIAGAFILNDMAFLPRCYVDIIYAWERLGPQWQEYVRDIKANHIHLIYRK